jgi:hypothetical protein
LTGNFAPSRTGVRSLSVEAQQPITGHIKPAFRRGALLKFGSIALRLQGAEERHQVFLFLWC